MGTSLVRWLKSCTPSAGGPGLIPGQRTRSHMPQLRVFVPQLKILCALTNTWNSQMGASLVAQSVKNLPATQEVQVRSLGWEDPLEKEIAPRSSILAWRIPRTEEPGRLQSMESQESDTTQRLNHHSQINIFLKVVKNVNFMSGIFHQVFKAYFYNRSKIFQKEETTNRNDRSPHLQSRRDYLGKPPASSPVSSFNYQFTVP